MYPFLQGFILELLGSMVKLHAYVLEYHGR